MNLEKMRHQLGRSTPDVMWKDFDILNSTQADTRDWIANFGRMMKYKHGANVKHIEVFQSELAIRDNKDVVRFQIHVRLWDLNKRHRNRITIHPEMMDGEAQTKTTLAAPTY